MINIVFQNSTQLESPASLKLVFFFSGGSPGWGQPSPVGGLIGPQKWNDVFSDPTCHGWLLGWIKPLSSPNQVFMWFKVEYPKFCLKFQELVPSVPNEGWISDDVPIFSVHATDVCCPQLPLERETCFQCSKSIPHNWHVHNNLWHCWQTPCTAKLNKGIFILHLRERLVADIESSNVHPGFINLQAVELGYQYHLILGLMV